MLRSITLFVVATLMTAALQAQIKYDGTFGKGMRFVTSDTSFSLKFATRIQPRYDIRFNDETNVFESLGYVKRARLKFDGFAFSEDFIYKIEYDVVGGYVRDAYIRWKFADNWEFRYGQGKLPGNRERVVSSGNLEFVDRSLFNAFFNIDRDFHFLFGHKGTAGKMVVKEMFGVSSGAGIRNVQRKRGLNYVARVELLPFGDFDGKDDYSAGDIKRTEDFKLSFAVTGDYNVGAYKQGGQIGGVLEEDANLLYLESDLLVKYRGWAFNIEAGLRDDLKGDGTSYLEDGITVDGHYWIGNGFTSSLTYVFESRWSMGYRYAQVDMDYQGFIQENSVVVSRYIVGHKLKVQSDVTWRMFDGESQSALMRIQMDFHF